MHHDVIEMVSCNRKVRRTFREKYCRKRRFREPSPEKVPRTFANSPESTARRGLARACVKELIIILRQCSEHLMRNASSEIFSDTASRRLRGGGGDDCFVFSLVFVSTHLCLITQSSMSAMSWARRVFTEGFGAPSWCSHWANLFKALVATSGSLLCSRVRYPHLDSFP